MFSVEQGIRSLLFFCYDGGGKPSAQALIFFSMQHVLYFGCVESYCFENGGIHMSNQKTKSRNPVGMRRNGPFDEALRSLSTHCKRWVLPVLNEAFEKDYLGDEQIGLITNENIMVPVFGSARKNPYLTESQFLITGHDGEKRRCQLECLSDNDWTVAFARDFGGIVGPKTRVEVLGTVVICLRISDDTPDEYTIRISSPDASTSWGVPVVKIPTYTLEELAAKRLYLLFPFHIFRFESQLAEMEIDADKRRHLIAAFEDINRLLSGLVETGKMSQQEASCIRKCCWKVARSLLKKHTDIRRDVKRIMGDKCQRK